MGNVLVSNLICPNAKPIVHSSISMSPSSSGLGQPRHCWPLRCLNQLLRKGHVVPGCYQERTNRKKVADTLSTEIRKMKECYPYFELENEQDAICNPLLPKQAGNQTNFIIIFGFY